MARPDLGSPLYAVGFAAAVCVVCSVVVSSAAVALRPAQEANKVVDRQKKVLEVAGLIGADEDLSNEEIRSRFEAKIEARAVRLATGEFDAAVDAAAFDQKKASKDPSRSRVAPSNAAKVARLPEHAVVYLVREDAALKKVVLPIEGKGLWSTLYGFLALGPDADTIEGITFYEHGETPGLGGEVDNPKWKALWSGRKAYGPDGAPRIGVKKGKAGSPSESPHEVDGLSGATITANGVTHLVRFWLGEDGFDPLLDRLRKENLR